MMSGSSDNCGFGALYGSRVGEILRECERALNAIPAQDTEALIRIVTEAEQIFFVGVGRSEEHTV